MQLALENPFPYCRWLYASVHKQRSLFCCCFRHPSPDIRSESAPVKVAHLIGSAIAARSGLMLRSEVLYVSEN